MTRQPRACLRGRTYRRWMNHPDRINYPMKRVGKRGEGKFERISWDEAIDLAATKLKEVIEKYGNEAVYLPYGDRCFRYHRSSVPAHDEHRGWLPEVLQQLLYGADLLHNPVHVRL